MAALAAHAGGTATDAPTPKKPFWSMFSRHKAEEKKPSKERPKLGLRTGAEVSAYDMGRTVDRHGNLREAHRVYAVTKSAHWNTNLPEGNAQVADGPKSVYVPPNYTPMPPDQRVNDAVGELKQATMSAHQAAETAVAQSNVLGHQVEQLTAEKTELERRLEEITRTPAYGNLPSAAPTPMSEAAKAGTAAADANDPVHAFAQGLNKGKK